MEKGQQLVITITDMSNEGKGIGKHEGMTIFADSGVLGDQVLVEITKVKKNYCLARVLETAVPSPSRVEYDCPVQEECGGCPLGSLYYLKQLEWKENLVRDRLIRLGGIENPLVRPIVGMDHPYRYRNKAQMAISCGGLITRKGGVQENLGKPAIGFYQARTHQVVDCPVCLIQSEAAEAVAAAVRKFMKEDNILAYDPKWEKGLFRHLVVKTALNTGEVMAILVLNGKGIPNAQKLVEMMDEAVSQLPPREDGIEYSLESVVVNVNKKKNSEILGEEFINIAGKPNILEEVGEYQFEISPGSFYQVNPVQMEHLYQKAAEYAGLTGKETVLDLYCGVGTIGLFCAKDAGKVIGIESVKQAVLDANRNATINGSVNATFICGKVEDVLPGLLSGQEGKDGEWIPPVKPDVVILDPPRSGCHPALLEAVAEAAPDRIVYVSCDPATLARDVKLLSEMGYEMKEATPVDMVPQTAHVETCVLLSHKKSQASSPSL